MPMKPHLGRILLEHDEATMPLALCGSNWRSTTGSLRLSRRIAGNIVRLA